ncbi:MAG: zinc-ribbon domain-containing protein [Candidatus Jordarchaeaceae archaeon]
MIQLIIEQGGYSPWLAGTICFIPIVWLIIGILLCIWVYRDAESRGMNGALWLIVVLISGIIGLIVYLVVRKEKVIPPPPPPPQVMRVCTNCGRGVPPDVKFCPYCGKPIPE